MIVSPTLWLYLAKFPETAISALASYIVFLDFHNWINLSTNPSSTHFFLVSLAEPTIAIKGYVVAYVTESTYVLSSVISMVQV